MGALQDKVQQAYVDGKKAGKAKQPSDSNPHRHFGPVRTSWLKGWEETYPSSYANGCMKATQHIANKMAERFGNVNRTEVGMITRRMADEVYDAHHQGQKELARLAKQYGARDQHAIDAVVEYFLDL